MSISKIFYSLIKRIKIIAGYMNYKKTINYIVCNRKTANVDLLLLPAIGDTICGLTYINSFLSENNVEINIYGNYNQKSVIDSFNIPANYYLFNPYDKTYKSICNIILNSKLSKKLLNKGIISNFNYNYDKSLKKTIDNSALYQMSNYVLKLKQPFLSYPMVKEQYISSIINFYTVCDKIIIINPYSNSLNVNILIFNKIVLYLRQRGFVIYTNVFGNQKELDGTFPLRCSIEELYSICKRIKMVVSVRSGILDYIIGTDCNIFAIFENCGSNYFDRFHLSDWKCNGVVRDCYIQKKNYFIG